MEPLTILETPQDSWNKLAGVKQNGLPVSRRVYPTPCA